MDLNPIKKFLGKLLNKIPSGKVEPIDKLNFFDFKTIIENYPNGNPPKVKLNPKEDIAFIQYTGGTTGTPKGAMIPHFNEVYNILQLDHWWEKDTGFGKEVVISGLPFCHMGGLFMGIGLVYYAGAQLLIPDPRELDYMIDLIEEWKPSFMANVPTVYTMFLENPRFREIDLSSIRQYISGGGPFPAEHIKEFEEVVGHNKVLELYGMTETGPLITCNPYFGKRKIGTVGLPIPNTQVKIVDIENKKQEVSIGEAGEIAVKGPQVFKGYWNKPKETEQAFRDGWFYTGDVGIMDEEGYITIVDRTKDMIIVGGCKVFSVEVDNKMSKHPAIQLASSIGVPDPKRPGSERVKLYVSLKDGHKADEDLKEDIMEYAKTYLAKHKVPKKIKFVNNLPLTPIGKVDKKALRLKQ
jgi:long-chain acyl-CoA synthetase